MSRFTARLVALVAACAWASVALADSFGTTQIVSNVRVASIFHGAVGPTAVFFTPAILPGCSGNAGGYLSTVWPDAMVIYGGAIDTHGHATQVALLLTAKAAGSTLEVRSRLNNQGTGWNNCAIDAVWVQ